MDRFSCLIIAFPKGQAALGALVLAAIALSPQRSGDVLLIPLTSYASARLPAIALQDGDTLIARGPFTGSLVVRASNIPVAKLASLGILAIAIRGAECGTVAGSVVA